MSAATIHVATSAGDIAAVKDIFLEYLAFIEDFLCHSLEFQGTDTEFVNFPDKYDCLLLAKVDGAPVAACGIKPSNRCICGRVSSPVESCATGSP